MRDINIFNTRETYYHLYIDSVSYTAFPSLVSVMLKRVGHPDSNAAICSRPILIDISTLTLSVALQPVTTFSSQGLFLVSRGCFACLSPRSWLHVGLCKLRAHLVKPDGFRVSLVSPPARWP